MLQGILFLIAPATASSKEVRILLKLLEKQNIRFALSVENCISEAPLSPLPPEDCLVITESAIGVTLARANSIPCIGYAPPEGTDNLSGAYALFEDFSSVDVGYLCRIHAHATGYPADILSTNRLIIREFCMADFPALYTMCTEPSTAAYMEECLSDFATEQEKHRAYLQSVYPFFDLALWGVFEQASGRLIGRAGFSLPEENDHTFQLGYLIDVPYRRQGYAKELIPALLSYAKEQGFPVISARIKAENTGSVRALEQCGFPYVKKTDSVRGVLTYLLYLNP